MLFYIFIIIIWVIFSNNLYISYLIAKVETHVIGVECLYSHATSK